MRHGGEGYRAIKREYFRLPPMNEMRSMLHGASFFTKLDLSNDYYHLELDKPSRDLTTFLSEGRMYRFKRLMFSVNYAPANLPAGDDKDPGRFPKLIFAKSVI